MVRPRRADQPGIIPAYAGSTPLPAGPLKSPPDHPRIRGEHYGFANLLELSTGIIPAYAGSTCHAAGV